MTIIEPLSDALAEHGFGGRSEQLCQFNSESFEK